MSDTGNADFTAKVTVDAEQAAAELEAKFTKAIVDALKSPQVVGAVEKLIKSITKAMQTFAKEQEKNMKAATKAGEKAAKTIGDAFKKVGKESGKAYDANKARGSTHELRAMNAFVESLAKNFDALATDARTLNTVLKELGAGVRAQVSAVERERRTLQQAQTSQNAIRNTEAQAEANRLTNTTKLTIAQLRAQTSASRNASNERIAHIRQFTQIATTSIRALTQVFRTVFNGATVIMRNFVNGVQAIFRGVAAAVRSAFRAVGATVRSTFQAINATVRTFASGFARAFSGIGRGVASALRGVSNTIRSALSRDEAATRASMSRRERMASSSSGRQGSFLTTAFQASGLAGGAAGIFNILRSGFERFSQVETLQFRFERFLGTAQKAKTLIQNLSDFARTTAFDLPGVANLATNFLAMGQSADQAVTNVKRLADVTAFAGGNTESLERIQRALGQIISTGKLQGDELNQLAENLPGINIRKIIADQMGISVAELAKMQSSGKISADAFIEAFLTGIDDPRFQGAAVAIAGTLEGRLANLKESFGIFGAEIIGLAYGPISTAMTKITNFLSLAGDFVHGTGPMFDTKPVHAEDNPYVNMADDALIAFEKLPKEWQNQLGSMFGWTAGAGYVVSAADAKQWWDNMHPPEADETVNRLKELRDIMADFAKGVGAGAAVAGGFKAIGLALRFLISPMTAAILLFGSIGVFWGKMVDASPKLQSSLELVGDAFGNVRHTLGQTFGIVGDLLSTAFFGKPNFFKNIGDKVTDFANRIGNMTNRFNNWLLRVNELLEDREFGKVFDSISRHVQDFAASLLGLTDAQQKAAQELGGNDFGNIFTAFLDKLQTVPVLGPIVGFARRVVGAVVGALKGAWAFAGNIWDIIFGGGAAADEEAPINAIFGTEDQRSTSTKILDRLEETFLGPVVRFFRGPFMDAIHGIGGFVSGVFDRFLLPGFHAVANFFAHDFIPGVISVASAVGRFFQPAVQTVGNLLGQVGTLLAPLGGAITGFVSTMKTDGIGKAFSNLWDGAKEAAGNLWDGEDGNGGIKAGLQSAIDSITSWFSTTFTGKNVSGWITSALDGIRKVGYAVGKFIGSPEFLGTVIVSAAAVTAAVAAVLGAFTVGLIEGLAKEGLRWGKLIAGALQDGWDNLAKGALSFVPDPVTDAISTMLGSPLIGTAIAGGVALLGGMIIKSLIGAIITNAKPEAQTPGAALGGANIRTFGINVATGLFNSVVSGFKGVGKGALSLAGMIIPRFPSDSGPGGAADTAGRGIATRVMGGMNTFFRRTIVSPIAGLKTRLDSIKDKAVANFGSVGTAIGAAVIGGIAAYEFGNYAGKKGDAGGIIMALLGGAATGGAIGAPFGGVGAGIGAAVGLAIAGLGVAIGKSGALAQEAADRINAYADAIRGLDEAARPAAGGQTIMDQLTEQFSETDQEPIRQFFVDAKFNADEFWAAFAEGNGNANTVLDDMVRNFAESGSTLIAQAGVTKDQLLDLAKGIEDTGGAYGSLEELQGALSRQPGGDALLATMERLKDAGVDLKPVIEFLMGTEGDITKARLMEVFRQQLEGVAAGVDDIDVEKLDTVEEGLSAIRDALTAGDTGGQIAALLAHSDLTTAQSLEAIGDAAGEVKTQLDDATQAFEDALKAFQTPDTVTPDTFRGVTDAFIAELPEMESAYNNMLEGPEEGVELNVVIANARENRSAKDFQDTLSEMIAAGTAEGLIVDDASMDTFLNELKSKLTAAGVDATDGAAGEMMFTMINSFIAGDFSTMIDPITGALTNQAKLQEAARLMSSTFGRFLAANFNLEANNISPDSFLGGLWKPPVPTSPVPAVTVPITPVTQADFAGAFSGVDPGAVGTDLSQGIADKLPDQLHTAAAPMKNELNAVGQGLHGTATSAGFLVGVQFTKSVGSGVTSATSDAKSKARTVVSGVQSSVAEGNQGMKSAGFNLGASMAHGIRESSIVAIATAINLARAVVSATRATLQIHSPSRVFVTIGRQIGEGFVEGIKDAEVSMTQALETAMTNAIQAATETAAREVNRANVATRLFTLLQPSILPGGTPTSDLTSAAATVVKQLGDFVKDLQGLVADATEQTAKLVAEARDKLVDAFDELAHGVDANEAYTAMAGIPEDFLARREDVRLAIAAATTHRNERVAYQNSLDRLNRDLGSGELARTRRNRLRGEAWATLQDAQDVMTDKIQRLDKQLARKSITQAQHDERVTNLRDAFNLTDMENYRTELDKIERAFREHKLGLEEYRELLDKLGERPDPLTREELQALRTGEGHSLDANSIIGRANREALVDAIQKIRDWGKAQLEAGKPLDETIDKMEEYIKKIRAEAKARGFNAAAIESLLDVYGLAAADLEDLADTYTSTAAAIRAAQTTLNIREEGGAENILKFNEQLGAIRDYASTLLEAGRPVAGVVSTIEAMVRRFRNAATAAGFRAADVDRLIADMGLSNNALAEFIRQLNAFTTATNAATRATNAANAANSGVTRAVGELHVHVPYGDPEAVGRATVNAMAYGGPTTW